MLVFCPIFYGFQGKAGLTITNLPRKLNRDVNVRRIPQIIIEIKIEDKEDIYESVFSEQREYERQKKL